MTVIVADDMPTRLATDGHLERMPLADDSFAADHVDQSKPGDAKPLFGGQDRRRQTVLARRRNPLHRETHR